MNGLEAQLFARIKGQDHVIPRVGSVLERGQLGLPPAAQPLGSLLFLGPTGLGKTASALEFLHFLYGATPSFVSICRDSCTWTARSCSWG
jgi:ATP-dependent Clp protease ATP-binding subunit ClpA